MIYKKAQGWGIDLLFGVSIFIGIVLLIYFFSMNLSGEKEEFDILLKEGERIMQEILSEGYPEEWNQTNVNKIGILSNEKINNTKIEIFYNLTQEDYILTKNIFRTKYDYFFTLNQEINLSSEIIEGIGKNFEYNETQNFIKIKRYTIYENKPVEVYLYLWTK